MRSTGGWALLSILLLACTAACGNIPLPPATLAPHPSATASQPAAAAGHTFGRSPDGMAMVYVPSGECRMGSTADEVKYARQLCRKHGGDDAISACRMEVFANEGPAHPVELDAFWIDQTEVTNGQYARCVGGGFCSPPVEHGSGTRDSYYDEPAYDSYPVIWVTQEQAAQYCVWAGGRLPTEAEWEYAARGPQSRIFPWGNDFHGSPLNYCDAACATGVRDDSVNDGYPETAPVGSFPSGASWCGALDMAGNVRELVLRPAFLAGWVADWFDYYAKERLVNPTGPPSGESRIPKGSCWLDRPDDTRSANHGENTPDHTRHKVGFRCAMDVAQGPSGAGAAPALGR